MNIFFDSPVRAGTGGEDSRSNSAALARDLDAWVRLSTAHAAEDSFRPRLSSDQWAALSTFLTKAQLRAGEVLFNQGDTDRALYFLLDGSLQAFPTPASGAAGQLVLMRPGLAFGEAGLFGPAPRLVNVEAIGASTVLLLKAQRLEELGLRSPVVAMEVLRAAGALLLSRARALSVKSLARV
jgi:CRP-like cAMP-binding protein